MDKTYAQQTPPQAKVQPPSQTQHTKQHNIPFQVAVHDGEKHLQKQVDGVYEHRQQV
jgi:hypothetical protein